MSYARARDDTRRAAIERSLASRFWLRFHMSIMLSAAFGAGFMTSYALLHAGVAATLVRWPFGTLVGYLVLFFCMRLWLAYIGVRPLWTHARGAGDDGSYAQYVDWPSGRSGTGDVPFRGGGGGSGGGGASGTWGEGVVRSTPSSGGGSKPGFGLDLGDGDAFKLLILVAIVLAVVAALGGSVIYLVASAPHLLADVAFGAALTSGMAPAARRVADGAGDWSGSVFKATWKPFAVILLVVVVAAVALAHYFPGATTLGSAFRML